MQSEGTHLPPSSCCLLGRWMGRRSWKMVSVQGAFPHSTACQSWYLSASNRGTGEDRQHLLSKLNYLLSTKQEGEPAPQPAPWSHIHTCILLYDHYGSLKGRLVYIFFIYLLTHNRVVRSAELNCSSAEIGAGLGGIYYQAGLCPAALWQLHDGGDSPELSSHKSSGSPKRKIVWVVENLHESIYDTSNQISLGGDATYFPMLVWA